MNLITFENGCNPQFPILKFHGTMVGSTLIISRKNILISRSADTSLKRDSLNLLPDQIDAALKQNISLKIEVQQSFRCQRHPYCDQEVIFIELHTASAWSVVAQCYADTGKSKTEFVADYVTTSEA